MNEKPASRQAQEILFNLGKKYAEMKSKYNALEKETKIKFSLMYNDYRSQGKSASDSEHLARADIEYQDMCLKLKAADYDYHVSWAALEAEKVSWEVYRTEQANKRAEQNQADRGI